MITSSRYNEADPFLDALLVELGIADDPAPEKHCAGSLAVFYTNQHAGSPNACEKCPKHLSCKGRHANHLDRIEQFFMDCFASKPEPEHRSLPEPKRCESCIVNRECHGATQMKGHATTTAKVIEFPTPPRIAPEAPPMVREEAPPPLFASQEVAQARTTMQSMGSDEVMALLQAASREIRAEPKAKTNYAHPLRVRFLAASIELNSRGIMPALRPACRAAPPKKGEPYAADDTKLSNDLRVIDLDYIAKNHPHGHGDDRDDFARLMNDDGSLNAEKAWEFVTQPGPAAKKAGRLILTPEQQAELFIIRDEKTRKRQDRLRDNRRPHLGKISSAIKGGRKGGDPAQHQRLCDQHWQIYALCVLLNWSVRNVLDAATRLSGMTLSDSTIRRTIPWLTKTAKLPAVLEAA